MNSSYLKGFWITLLIVAVLVIGYLALVRNDDEVVLPISDTSDAIGADASIISEGNTTAEIEQDLSAEIDGDLDAELNSLDKEIDSF